MPIDLITIEETPPDWQFDWQPNYQLTVDSTERLAFSSDQALQFDSALSAGWTEEEAFASAQDPFFTLMVDSNTLVWWNFEPTEYEERLDPFKIEVIVEVPEAPEVIIF